MADEPQGAPMQPLTRDRCIAMLNNFANGIYQAIGPDVCRAAAHFLQNSTPNEEAVVKPDGDPAAEAGGCSPRFSREPWRATTESIEGYIMQSGIGYVAPPSGSRSLATTTSRRMFA